MGNKINHFGLPLIVILVVSLMTTIIPSVSPAAEIVWKYQSAVGRGTYAMDLVDWWADQIKKESKGRMVIDVYPSSGLGIGIRDALSSVSKGLIEAIEVVGSHNEGTMPTLTVLELPGVMPPDYPTRYKILDAVQPYFKSKMAERGVVLIQISQWEGRNLYTKKLVRKPADLKGQRIRVSGAVDEWVVKTWGGAPTYMPWADVYMGLERGTVDGFTTTHGPVYAAKVYEQIEYFMETKFGGTTASICINRKAFDALPADLQKIVMDTGVKAFRDMWRESQVKEETVMRNNLIKAGKIWTPTDPEFSKLIEEKADAFLDVWLKLAGAEGQEVLKILQDAKKSK